MGVPQGSILGPILFNIFMNDLSYAIAECTLFTYADDTQLFKSAENIDQAEHAITADLKKMDGWLTRPQSSLRSAAEGSARGYGFSSFPTPLALPKVTHASRVPSRRIQ